MQTQRGIANAIQALPSTVREANAENWIAGALGDPDDIASGSSDDPLMMGALRCLHGVAILYGCLLACFSFRGFLRFGSLVHMVFTVVQDIAPFLGACRASVKRFET